MPAPTAADASRAVPSALTREKASTAATSRVGEMREAGQMYNSFNALERGFPASVRADIAVADPRLPGRSRRRHPARPAQHDVTLVLQGIGNGAT